MHRSHLTPILVACVGAVVGQLGCLVHFLRFSIVVHRDCREVHPSFMLQTCYPASLVLFT